MTNMQFQTDSKGKKTAVVIPIAEWKKYEKSYKDILARQSLVSENSKLFVSLSEGLKEVELHQNGKIKLPKLTDLINEL